MYSILCVIINNSFTFQRKCVNVYNFGTNQVNYSHSGQLIDFFFYYFKARCFAVTRQFFETKHPKQEFFRQNRDYQSTWQQRGCHIVRSLTMGSVFAWKSSYSVILPISNARDKIADVYSHKVNRQQNNQKCHVCLLYTSPFFTLHSLNQFPHVPVKP